MLGCCSLMETNGFPLIGVSSAGSRPGGRLTSLLRQRSNQERRPRFTGLLLKRCLIKRLPCAARIGRPAQNSPAARAQTAAPEGPARCCAARRLRGAFNRHRAFTEAPGVIDEFVRVRGEWVRLSPSPPLECRVTPCGLTRPTQLFPAFRFSPFHRSHTPVLQGAVIPKSPF